MKKKWTLLHKKLKKHCSKRLSATKTAKSGPRKKSKEELGLRMNAQRKKGPTYQRQMKER
jgi:hypothetical protein